MKIVNPKLNIDVPNTNNPLYIIIHHALAKTCSIFDIHKWHLAMGWAGCGYHYFISKEGIIYQGRDEKQRGSHCKQENMNSNSIGICLEGCYEKYKNQTDKEVPAAQLIALIELTKDIQERHNIPTENVKKHHDLASYKLCPGDYFPWDKYINRLPKCIFPDLEMHWTRESVEKVVEEGIMNGYPDGEFKPNVFMTRGEYAVATARALEVVEQKIKESIKQ